MGGNDDEDDGDGEGGVGVSGNEGQSYGSEHPITWQKPC